MTNYSSTPLLTSHRRVDGITRTVRQPGQVLVEFHSVLRDHETGRHPEHPSLEGAHRQESLLQHHAELHGQQHRLGEWRGVAQQAEAPQSVLPLECHRETLRLHVRGWSTTV